MSQRLRLFACAVTCFVTGLFISTSVFADKDHHHKKSHHHKQKLAVEKVKNGLSVIVLGSGAPIALPNGRASAGYMIMVNGEPRILMDVGGGVYQRIGDAGLNIANLDRVLISHLHIDHMGDITPIVKSIYFHNRAKNQTRSDVIHFYGPDAAPESAPPPALDFDATTTFTDGHFHQNTGLQRYLHRFAPAIGAGTFNYMAHDIAHNNAMPMKTVFESDDGLVVKAIGVPHGPVPSLAFRVEYDGKSIVYSGDTSSTSANDNMINLSQNADLLIYDTAILDDAQPPFSILHTTPTRIGEVASAANVKKLVLSHLTPSTDQNIKAVKKSVRRAGYHGSLKVARDLQVYNLHDD